MGLKQSDSDDKGQGSQSEVLAAGWYGVPLVPDKYVRRPRLLALLAAGDSCPVVLVSAPAGSGKSSLVADWVGSRSPSTGTEYSEDFNLELARSSSAASQSRASMLLPL